MIEKFDTETAATLAAQRAGDRLAREGQTIRLRHGQVAGSHAWVAVEVETYVAAGVGNPYGRFGWDARFVAHYPV